MSSSLIDGTIPMNKTLFRLSQDSKDGYYKTTEEVTEIIHQKCPTARWTNVNICDTKEQLIKELTTVLYHLQNL